MNLEETKGFIGHDSLCMPFFKWATTFQAGMNRTCSSVVLATVTSFGANLSSKKNTTLVSLKKCAHMNDDVGIFL